MSTISSALPIHMQTHSKVLAILQNITHHQTALENGDQSGEHHYRLGKQYAELAHMCEQFLEQNNSTRFYGMAFQSYNQAIKLQPMAEDYYKARDLLPTRIHTPEIQRKMYQNVILHNKDDAEKLQERATHTHSKPNDYEIHPLQFEWDYLQNSLKTFQDKKDASINLTKRNYYRDHFISIVGAVLGAVGLVGIGLGLATALPAAALVGAAVLAGTHYFGQTSHKASQKLAELEYNTDVEHFLRDQLQTSITQRHEAMQACKDSMADANTTPEHSKNWAQSITAEQDAKQKEPQLV